MPQEQGAQQGRDVQAVGICVCKNAYLVIAQIVQVGSPGSTPSATLMSCTSCEARISAESTSQVFRILPRNGMIACVLRSRACLAEPPAESPSTRKISHSSGSCDVQSASLPGKAGPETIFLRTTFLAAFNRFCALLMASCAIWSPVSGMLVQPQRKAVLDDASDKCRRLTR